MQMLRVLRELIDSVNLYGGSSVGPALPTWSFLGKRQNKISKENIQLPEEISTVEKNKAEKWFRGCRGGVWFTVLNTMVKVSWESRVQL